MCLSVNTPQVSVAPQRLKILLDGCLPVIIYLVADLPNRYGNTVSNGGYGNLFGREVRYMIFLLVIAELD